MTNPTRTIEQEDLGVLEAMFDASARDAAMTKDMVELCLRVYANYDALTTENIKEAAYQEWGQYIEGDRLENATNRMLSEERLMAPGYLEPVQREDGASAYRITDKGLAYLWDKFASRTHEDSFDKYGAVIAKNKRLGDPTRHIESHDLYALTLLAVLKMKKSAASTKEIREVLEAWIQPSGINAEVLESEKKYPTPLNRFQRKFHNMLSSHNDIVRDGLLERTSDLKTGDTHWLITEKGKAVLMKRTLKEKRNLTLQMASAALQNELATHMSALKMLAKYTMMTTSTQEAEAIDVLSNMVTRLIDSDRLKVENIHNVLVTPETLTRTAYKRKP